MTLTPREYLHQHFGPADRRWIESLSDDRAMDIIEEVSRIDAKRRGMSFVSYRELEALHPLPDVHKAPFLTWDGAPITPQDPDVPGEYENWR